MEEILMYVKIELIDGTCFFDYTYIKMSELSEDDVKLVNRVPAMSWEDIIEDQAMCDFFELKTPNGRWRIVEGEDQNEGGNMLLKIKSHQRITQIVNIFEYRV